VKAGLAFMCKKSKEELEAALNDQMNRLKIMNELLEAGIAEELRKNREKDARAMQQDRLASIGQLAAGVAHEINNPLGFVKGNLNTLKEFVGSLQKYLQVVDELSAGSLTAEKNQFLKASRKKYEIDYIFEEMQPLLAESVEGVERVSRIVTDLKDFARPGSNGMQEADLNRLVCCTINVLCSELKHVARLDTQLPELPSLVCCPQEINQVIAHLLMNAAHAVEQGGTISISTFLEDSHLILMISDTGTGIPPELQLRIFEPFFTTKDVGKGTGLGLSVCYDIIKKHGGEIVVASAVGAGTTFTVKLPLAPVVR
jgi:two-component system, NtrC family, sensor kinase